MKKLILSFSLCCSLCSPMTLLAASSQRWYDLELYNHYELTQEITFENGVSFKAGQKFEMQDFIGGGVPIAYFEMHSLDCKDPDQTADMILVEIDSIVVGAQLYEGCNLGFYIEPIDFFNKSAFTLIE